MPVMKMVETWKTASEMKDMTSKMAHTPSIQTCDSHLGEDRSMTRGWMGHGMVRAQGTEVGAMRTLNEVSNIPIEYFV